MRQPVTLHYAAFTRDPAGGNPAGVVISDQHPSDADMQSLAAQIGASETAFLRPVGPEAPGEYRVRYFSPAIEVPFCGHATIASAVALAERGAPARLMFHTNGGAVPVDITRADGVITATLTSLPPHVSAAAQELVTNALTALRWAPADLDPRFPPAVSFAGAQHLVLATRTLATLAALDYDFEALRALMLAHDLTTLQLVWQEGPRAFRARNPFPIGGVIEDPATGAAAAALGAYLRAYGLVPEASTFTIRQGLELGRPSLLTVELVAGQPGVRVSGTAVVM